MVFFSSSLIPSHEILAQYLRIPDVMARVVKAKEILQKNKLPPHLWMYGLSELKKGAEFSVHRNLMSFVVSLGFYDRFVRLYGAPEFLIGSSLAVSVAARMRTYERSIIKILMGADFKGRAMKIYKKKNLQPISGWPKPDRFLLLSLSQSFNHHLIFQSLKDEYQCSKGVLISTAPFEANTLSISKNCDFALKDFISMDSRLAWLWPALYHSRSGGGKKTRMNV